MQGSQAVETAEISNIQREDVTGAVNVHRCCQARVVDPNLETLYFATILRHSW